MMLRGTAGLLVLVIASSGAAAVPGDYDDLIVKHAAANNVPEQLIRHVIRIESRGDPSRVSKGNYGLMQIRLGTARAMGYGGPASGLLDADTNMKYAVKYLAGAYRAAGCDAERAVAYYRRGYHGVRHASCRDHARLAETKQTKDGANVEPSAQIAQAKSDGNLQIGQDSSNAKLKPKVVRTVLIPLNGSSSSASKIERPARVEPVAAKTPVDARSDTFAARASMRPVEEPVTTGARTNSEPEALPVPRVRPPERNSKEQTAKPDKTASHPKPRHTSRRSSVGEPQRRERRPETSPSLLSMLKKLITPDQTTSRGKRETQR